MEKLIYKVCLFIIFAFCSCKVSAQGKTDSLKKILLTEKDDTNKVKTLNKLSAILLNKGEYDSGLFFSTHAEMLSESLKFIPGLSKAKYYTGLAAFKNENYNQAYISLINARKLFQQINDQRFVAICFRWIGNIFQQQYNYADALDNYYSGYALSERIKDTDEVMNALSFITDLLTYNKRFDKALEYAKIWETYAYNQKDNEQKDMVTERLGEVYENLGDFKSSLSYHLKSLHLSEIEKDTEGVGNSYQDIAKLYKSIYKYDSSVYYFSKAANVYQSIKDTGSFADTYFNRFAIYKAEKKDQLAMHFLKKSLQLYGIIKDTFNLADSYFTFGETYLTAQQYLKALTCFQKGLNLALRLKNIEETRDAYQKLSTVYEKLNESVNALSYYKKFVQLRDSISKKQSIENLSQLEEKRSFENTVEKNKIKETQQQLTSRIELNKKTTQRNYYIIGFVIVLVLLILITNKYRQSKKTEALINAKNNQLFQTLNELKSTQAQLIQSEKMASLGELTAGIAHEIQNPLNFVNNFSEISRELIDELKSQKSKLKSEEQDEILNDIDTNLEKINHHGKRADAIVKGMLQHSRQTKGTKEPTDINALCDEYLRLSFHGLRAKDKNSNADFTTEFDESIGKINIVPQDVGRVLLNLFNNAFYAVNEKNASTSSAGQPYKPIVSVQTKKLNDQIEIRVSDNGNGIPQNIIDKIFQPFFTTKPTGQGTGLGLSLAYDIITKEHNGTIKVESKRGESTTFIVTLPVS